MVLTRLSHVGEVCPLSDHSYSDPVLVTSNQNNSNRQTVSVSKRNTENEEGETSLHPQTIVINILEFPTEVVEKIFSYITYKNLGDVRRVCKRFDRIGANVLNTAFQRLQNQMLVRFQATKSQMPRRESARRKHPLARESDILETLHMRLTLLQMTFGKHIERKHCCFFAGEILDEVYRILRCIKSTPNMGKVFKITDELFDLSSMAMEYFKEHIEPGLPEISYFGSEFLDISNRFSEGGSGNSSAGCGRSSEPEDEIPERDSLPPSNMVLRKRIRKIRQGMKRYNSQLTCMKRELKTCKSKVVDQNKQLMEYASRMEEFDKKFEESSRKFSTVLQELNKCKTELQYWRSKSPVHPLVYCSCGRLSSDTTGSGEAPNASKDVEDKTTMGVPVILFSGSHPCSLLPSYHAPTSPSPSSSVKNLEPLFDLETVPDSLTPIPLTLVPYASEIAKSPNSIYLKEDARGDCSEGGQKRIYSDDDSDVDVDTVGRRVKERKRIKL